MGKLLPLGRRIEGGLSPYGLGVEVRVERLVKGLDVLQPRTEVHVEAVADHLEQLAEQLAFHGRQAPVLQHPFLQCCRLDRKKVLPPVEKLVGRAWSTSLIHDLAYYPRSLAKREAIGYRQSYQSSYAINRPTRGAA